MDFQPLRIKNYKIYFFGKLSILDYLKNSDFSFPTHS
jgi:hypothetical protein